MPSKTSSRPLSVEQQLMRKDLDIIVESIKEIQKLISSNYVTKSDFDPVKGIVYGAVKIVLGSVILSILALVLSKGGVI